jgi:hypothetical protein
MSLSSTPNSQNEFQNNCKTVTLDIKPVMLLFFIPFKVDIDKHTLKPDMAPVNCNILNEMTWINIVHTFMGKFCNKSDSKINTMPMEDMVHDDCVIKGYLNKIRVFTLNMQYFPKWKTLLAMWHNLREISLHVLSGNNR